MQTWNTWPNIYYTPTTVLQLLQQPNLAIPHKDKHVVALYSQDPMLDWRLDASKSSLHIWTTIISWDARTTSEKKKAKTMLKSSDPFLQLVATVTVQYNRPIQLWHLLWAIAKVHSLERNHTDDVSQRLPRNLLLKWWRSQQLHFSRMLCTCLWDIQLTLLW